MNIPINIENVVLKTERLTLRPFQKSDLEDFYAYAKVPGVGEMAGWKHHESIEDSQMILDMFINNKNVFAIEFEGKVIGSIGIEKYSEELLPELDAKQARELGFVLSRDYHRKGIMTEALKRVICYCFEDLKLDVLVAGHYSFNYPSERTQEKLGFRHYKRERKHYSKIWGKEDEGWYSLLYPSDFYTN